MRKSFVLRNLLLCSCWASSCFGQWFTPGANPPVNANAASQTKVNVAGTVVNSVTGEPIRRALVELAGANQRSTFTGADGRFQMTGVPEGRAFFSVQKPGFFGEQQLAKFGSVQRPFITVSTGMAEVALKLIPAGRIAGQIVSNEGEPIEDVNVQVTADEIVNGRRRRQLRGGGSSDDTGHFVIDNLQPGSYFLHTGPHQAMQIFTPSPVDQNQPPTYPSVYYPNAPDITSAQAIDLKPGQDVQADFTLRVEPVFRVTGQVIGATNGLQVMDHLPGGMPTFHPLRFDAKTGHFVLFLTSGSWKLKFTSNDRQQTLSANQDIDVKHAEVDNLQVTLSPGASIPIRIDRSAVAVTANSPPMQAFVGGINGSLRGQQVQLTLRNGSDEIGARYEAPVNGSTENTQVFHNVPPGSYRLSAQVFGNACISSISSGGADLLRDELTVSEGAQMPPIAVALRSDCGTIQASVHFPSTDAADASGVVLLVPDSDPTEAKIMPVQANTATKLTGLSPGDYKLYALSNVDGLEYGNPEALKDFPSQHVTVDANGNSSVSLDLVARGNQ